MTAWRIEYSDRARRQLRKLDRQVRERIREFIRAIPELETPRSKGGPLSGPLGDFWRYRVGDYRIVCDIQDNVLIVEVVKIGHRGDVYRGWRQGPNKQKETLPVT